MLIERVIKHLICMPLLVRRYFPPALMDEIQKLISASEIRHAGQICFCVENALDLGDLLRNVTPRERAEEVFSKLRVWNTENNSGVLVYVLFADHQLEIVADRGIARLVPQAEWEKICLLMEESFRQRDFAAGVRKGLSEISELLARHFPAGQEQRDELSNKPVML